MKITRETVSVEDVVKGKAESPLDLSVIPNHMGINLCSVESVTTSRLPDGQLIDLSIQFLPDFGDQD